MEEATLKTPKGATEVTAGEAQDIWDRSIAGGLWRREGRRTVRCDRCHEVTHYKMRDGHLIAVLFPKCECESEGVAGG